MLAPFRLKPWFSERPWGRLDLDPWYTPAEIGPIKEPIGEAWLTGPASMVASGLLVGKTLEQVAKEFAEELLGRWQSEGEFPLLLKLLFPDQKLSVQVHPDDEAARRIGQPRGKTECWYVLQADPGAAVALGLRPGTDADAIRNAVADGSMESLMERVPVVPGDMVFVDAGTMHAILPGVTILETQQTSDTTYRVYDYGRPRELHLEQGLAVTRYKTDAGKVAPRRHGHGTRLIEQQYFTVDRFAVLPGQHIALSDAVGRPHCFTTIGGNGTLRYDGGQVELLPGTSVVVPASCGPVELHPSEKQVVTVRSMP